MWWVKFPKTQGKNPKLKQKTKTLGGSCLGLPPNCMIEKSLIYLDGKKPDERGKIYEGKIMPPEKLQNGKLCKGKT